MLIDSEDAFYVDPILVLVASVGGQDGRVTRLRQGVYRVNHFGGTCYMRDYEHWPEGLSVGPFGVCDNYEQVLAKCPELESGPRKFVLIVHKLLKANQDPSGGWRWHKWGEYIGVQAPQCEYLYDEPVIEEVYTYHLYEKIAPQA